ncbi:MAG: hypothetical protein QW594_00870 [Candidatus Woesearchaeota archaeon]
MKNAQSSIEFIIIVTFLILMITVLLVVITDRINQAQQAEDLEHLRQLASIIVAELDFAGKAPTGYYRQFYLPPTVKSTREYELSYFNGSSLGTNFTIISVSYTADQKANSIIDFTYGNITGAFKKGTYNNLTKEKEKVCINWYPTPCD